MLKKCKGIVTVDEQTPSGNLSACIFEGFSEQNYFPKIVFSIQIFVMKNIWFILNNWSQYKGYGFLILDSDIVICCERE